MMSYSNSSINDTESAAEFVATVRAEHVAMKRWYNEHAPPTLKEEYGPNYPDLWKQVLNWPGWRPVRKSYLNATTAATESTNSNIIMLNNSPTAASNDALPRKRKSRWGKTTTLESSNETASSDSQRGRSTMPKITHNSNPTSTGTATLLLPGLSQVPQTPEVARLQEELRLVAQQLSNVDNEAARIDQLPPNHPDRSPSPPPSELLADIARWICFVVYFVD